MSDIVERLRQGVDSDNIQETEAAMDVGANEIERLKVALREIELIAPNIAIAQEIARVTLKGEAMSDAIAPAPETTPSESRR